MEVTKFTGKQLLILLGINVLAGVVAGLVVHYMTKPKTDPTTIMPPPAAKQGTTPPVVTTTTPVGEAA